MAGYRLGRYPQKVRIRKTWVPKRDGNTNFLLREWGQLDQAAN